MEDFAWILLIGASGVFLSSLVVFLVIDVGRWSRVLAVAGAMMLGSLGLSFDTEDIVLKIALAVTGVAFAFFIVVWDAIFILALQKLVTRGIRRSPRLEVGLRQRGLLPPQYDKERQGPLPHDDPR